jgi:tRNA(Arg) A34 adenosine deaminase TadA
VDAATAWNGLDEPWQACFEEAWTSWVNGSAGVGAVVVDRGEQIIARGRNRMLEPASTPRVIADTPLAHAEMNALAQLSMGAAGGCTIYTTFEPCLMCASTIIQCGLARVRYAAADPVFDGLHDWFGELQFAADRLPARTILGGPLGAFAHVLHLSWLTFWMPAGPVLDAHRIRAAAELVLADEVARDGRLAAVANAGGTICDAIELLWSDLDRLTRLGDDPCAP